VDFQEHLLEEQVPMLENFLVFVAHFSDKLERFGPE
jgi:hypothetical protein